MTATRRVFGRGACPLSPAGAQLFGWGLVAAVQTLVVALRVPWPEDGLPVRALHHIYDIGQILAVGIVAFTAAYAWERLTPRRGPVWRLGALWVLATGVMLGVAGEDFRGPSRQLGQGEFVGGYRFVLSLAFAAVIPAAAACGRALRRPRWRWLALVFGALWIAAGAFVYPRQYAGLHVLVAWAGAAGVASAFVGAPMVLPRSRRGRRAGLLAIGAMAFSTLVVWPPNAVVVEIFRSPGAIVAPYWARAFATPDAGRPVQGEDAHWFVPREGFPPHPPSQERMIPEDAIVILMTVDAIRADVMQSRKHDEAFPTLAGLRDESLRFTRARATGSQTVYTITTLFSGTHFSQQYWSELRGELWPHEDPSVRFPEILSEGGIDTVTYGSAWWLTNRAGVVRGFDEAEHVKTPEDTAYNFTLARDLIDAAIDRIEGHESGPMFLYMHFMDPHAPYNLGGTTGTAFENYIAEIGYFDRHLERLMSTIKDEGLGERTVFLITADHGEAFGEHDTTEHATTLYEELLRVPLFIRVPGVRPRSVDEPVSTIDLGPTILDLFGEVTPGHYLGQSLVPFLRREDPVLTRPVIAEGRLMQALVDRNGIKAIRDLRRNTREAYDLREDPGELENIHYDERAQRTLSRLARFFEVHTRREDGYEVPYRK